MAPRGLSTRRRRLQNDKEADKDKEATTSAPTASPTTLEKPKPGLTDAPTMAETTTPPVLPPPTLSPTVSTTTAPVPSPTRAPTVPVTPAPVVPRTPTPTPAIAPTQAPVLPSTSSPTTSATTPAPVPVTTTPQPSTAEPITTTSEPTTAAPVTTASPTSPVPVTTESPTAAGAITNPTSLPTVSTGGPSSPEVAVPTLAPTFSLDSVVQSIHLQFSTWTDSTLTVEEQEASLLEILNAAMCSTGVQLISRNMSDACPPGVWQDLGEPTVMWNQPLAFATPVDTSYWRWNFTYSVLELGYQTQDALQGMLNESITSGGMDETLKLQWEAPSRAKMVGTEKPIITGVPQHSAEILRIIGIILAVLTVLVVWLLTCLARRHRQRKDAKTVQIVFSSSSMEGSGANVNLEEMLSQSREIALQQKPTIPPSLLPAVSSEDDDEDDIALGTTPVDLDILDF